MKFDDFAREAGKEIDDLANRITPPQFAGLRVSGRRRAIVTTASALTVAAILVAGFVALWLDQDGDLPLVGVSTSTTLSTAITSTTETAPASTTTGPEHTTTTTAATTTTTQPSTTTEPAPLVVLASDGLGIVQFGADPQTTIASISAELGSPDDDTGWHSEPQPAFGVCGGSEWRLVRWGQLGVLFTDEADPNYAPQGQPHFAMYGYGGWIGVPEDQVPLQTPPGLTLGATVEGVLALYGQSATFIAGDEVVEPYVWIDLGDPNPQLVFFYREEVAMAIHAGRVCEG